MHKFGFVILHYKTQFDTIDCIESLKSLEGNIEIIVVDNHSENGSIEEIKEQYKGTDNIHFILNQDNLGFAKGNNVGIEYAFNVGCDFICILNNDTIIKQPEFVQKAIEDWELRKYSISGPRIISTVDGLDQNPFMVPKHYVKGTKDALILFLIGLIKYIVVYWRLPMFWKKNVSKKQSYTDGLEKDYLISTENDFLLHGACLIFSPSYFEKYKKMCDRTFMYEEETIIYYLSHKLGYKYTYNPNITIYHKEQSSTNYSIDKPRTRLLFGYREDLKSRFVLLKLTLVNKSEQADLLK